MSGLSLVVPPAIYTGDDPPGFIPPLTSTLWSGVPWAVFVTPGYKVEGVLRSGVCRVTGPVRRLGVQTKRVVDGGQQERGDRTDREYKIVK